jgi:hypothetical protein
MADADMTGDSEAARLEAALARIARAATARPPLPTLAPASTQPDAAHPGPTTEIRSRLDALIIELRSVLGRDSSD